MQISELLNLFLYELQEEMDEYSNTILEMEKSPTIGHLLDDAYINVHTIKGSSKTLLNSLNKEKHFASLNIKTIADISHKFEDLLDALKKKSKFSEEEINAFFEFEKIILELKDNIETEEPILINETKIKNFLELVEKLANNYLQDNYDGTKNSYRHFFNITLTSDEEYKHGYLSIVYRDIKDNYTECYFNPTEKQLLKNEEFETITIQIVSDDTTDNIKNFLKGLENIGDVINIPYNYTQEAENHSTENKNKPTIRDFIKNNEKKEEQKRIKTQPIRIDPKRIDNVLKHTSKLVILKNKLDQFLIQSDFLAGTAKRKELEAIFSEINSHVDYLQESVLEIRMTPFDQLFSRFPEDIRTISKEYGKPIKFSTQGGSTEIDKSILDELFDPFMHLIRNAIIHGIELPEERVSKGKEPEGNILILAKHDKNRVVITIKDDGKGIDLETVKEVAINKNIISPSNANNMSRNELLELIFKSGISTSNEVTEYSGRGIGMEAVRRKIDAINGTINVSTIEDDGTTVTLFLPLTTAIIEGMIAKINGDYFTFPISQVEEVINISKNEIRNSSDKFYFFLKDKEIPIIFSDDFFGYHPNNDDNNNPFLKLMILRSNNYVLGFTIDEFLGQQSIVVKTMHPFVQSAKGISSCNILGDGSISLIVDSNDLLTHLTKK